MKVTKNGKEVKNASVIYNSFGNPEYVVENGVNYDPKGYKIEDDQPTKKTRTASATTNRSKSSKAEPKQSEVIKDTIEATADQLMTTKNTPKRK